MGTRKKRSRHPLHGFFTLRQKQEEAIKFIQDHCPPEGYFLGFSGGKDSTVLKHLTEISKVKHQAYYSSTGIDPPELVKYIRKYHPDTIFLHPKASFYQLTVKWFAPTRTRRWCCKYLKENPARSIPLNHRLVGIRAEESLKRKVRGRINKFGKQIIYSPIFNWIEYDVWEYIDKYKLPYCALYDEGFDRLGCVVCPFICGQNSKRLERAKNRWPKIYKAFERAMEQLYENKEWYRQKSKGWAMLFEEFLENWYTGRAGKGGTYKK